MAYFCFVHVAFCEFILLFVGAGNHEVPDKWKEGRSGGRGRRRQKSYVLEYKHTQSFILFPEATETPPTLKIFFLS